MANQSDFFGGVAGLSITAIHSGFISMANTETTTNVTIPSVDLTRSIVIPTGFNNSFASAGINDINGFLELTSSTNLKLERSGSGAILECGYQVIEFSSVGSIQNIQIPSINGQTNFSISSVDVSKSILIERGQLISVDDPRSIVSANISSSTSITYKAASSSGGEGYFTVLELP